MVTLSRMSATITSMLPVGSDAKRDLISWEAVSGFVSQMASGLDQRLLAEVWMCACKAFSCKVSLFLTVGYSAHCIAGCADLRLLSLRWKNVLNAKFHPVIVASSFLLDVGAWFSFNWEIVWKVRENLPWDIVLIMRQFPLECWKGIFLPFLSLHCPEDFPLNTLRNPMFTCAGSACLHSHRV